MPKKVARTVNKIKLDCTNCGKEIQKFPCQIKGERNYCNQKCRAEYQTKTKRVEVMCAYCGKKSRIIQSKKKYDNSFCNMVCRIAYKVIGKKTRKELWTAYNQSPKGIEKKRKWHEINYFGMSGLISGKDVHCAICESGDGLLIHHVDGNNGRMGKILNNTPKNLVVLCRHCHPKVHNHNKVINYKTIKNA